MVMTSGCAGPPTATGCRAGRPRSACGCKRSVTSTPFVSVRGPEPPARSATMSTVVEPLGTLPRPDRPPTVRAASNPVRADRLSGLVDLVFRNTVAAPVWLVVRVWLGYEWLSAGMEKLSAHGAGSWFGHAPALAGFVHGADASWANRAKAF